MDFFRRLLNNPDDDTEPNEDANEQNPMDDKYKTAELPPDPDGAQTDKLDNKVIAEETPDAPDSAFRQDELDTLPQKPTDFDERISEKSVETGKLAELQDSDVYVPPAETPPIGITRPLPQEPILQNHQGHLVYGQASDTGRIRTNNQDAVLTFFFGSDSSEDIPDFGVFIVADGMGGHLEGERASALTARLVMRDIFKSIYFPMLDDDDLDADRPTITEALIQSIKAAHDKVHSAIRDGGTTFTGVVILGNQAYFGHVGDSRAYLIQQDGIEQITRDHSVVQRLIELDQLTPEEAETHEQRNVLYRAVGQNEEVEVDILRRRVPANSYILLCSDGLWGMVREEEIHNIVINTDDPQEACDKLIALGNTNGGTDNISVVILKLPSS